MKSSFIRLEEHSNPMMLDPPDPKMYLQPSLTEKDVLQLWEVFVSFDFDEDGKLNPMDIRSALTKYGYQAKKETAFQILAEYDEEEAGELDFESFLKMCAKNHNQKNETRAHIRSVYLRYDKTQKGYFDVNDLKQVAKELGEKVDDEVLQEMISSCDTNFDNKVTFEDFYMAMTKRLF